MRGLVLVAVLAASRVQASPSLLVPTNEDTSIYGDCKSTNVLTCVKVRVTFDLLEQGATSVIFPDGRVMARITNVYAGEASNGIYFQVRVQRFVSVWGWFCKRS